jgi:TrmH family RNA methyltransferase
MSLLANIRIVLVEPEFPGNIGSSARALCTMGLSQLVVVRPQCDPLADEAQWLAHNSINVLRNLRVADSLEEALAGTVFSVGTSMRTRRVWNPIYTPEEAAALLRERCAAQPGAIVFGRESTGLTNPELALCSIQSTIPLATEHQSLNLAQAVLIYCHALYQGSLTPAERSYDWKLAEHGDVEYLYAHLAQTLARLRFKPATTMEGYVSRFRRLLGRVPLEPRDVRLLHKILSLIDERLPEEPQ